MFKRGAAFGAFSLGSYLSAIVSALAFWPGLGSPVWAAASCSSCAATAAIAPPGHWTETDRWAWAQIKQSKQADLNKNCRTTPPLDPKSEEDHGLWEDSCRALSARFLEDVLTKAPWKDEVAFEGVRIVGSKINGDINLEDAKLARPIIISDSWIDGEIKLNRVRTDNLISLQGSRMDNGFDAEALQSESDIVLRRIVTDGEVNLSNAKIAGDVDLTGARGTLLGAEYMHVGGSLNMRPQDLGMGSQYEIEAGFQDIDLKSAKIDGDLLMARAIVTDELNLKEAKIIGDVDVSGAQINGWLFAEDFHVSGSLDMRPGGRGEASFQDVDLRHAKIDGNVEMAGAHFNGELDCNSLQVGGILSMSEAHKEYGIGMLVKGTVFENQVDLDGADIKNQLRMRGANFRGQLFAYHMHVGKDLIMRNAHSDKTVDMSFTRVDGSLDLGGASLNDLDLRGASIYRELRLLRDVDRLSELPGPPTAWTGTLNLRNARVDTVVSANDAWPPAGRLLLAGFTFDQLSMLHENVSGQEVKSWDRWAKLDPDYDPNIYTQMATAFTKLGNRGNADLIRYLGIERKRGAACNTGGLDRDGTLVECVIMTAQHLLTGYGIGLRVFISVFVLSFGGAALLRWTVPAAKERGLIWCLLASLAQLLPGMDTINKEFTEFFYDPERTRLKGWQVFVFSTLRIVGLALSATVIAAISGLTQAS